MARRSQLQGTLIAGHDGVDQQMIYVDAAGLARVTLMGGVVGSEAALAAGAQNDGLSNGANALYTNGRNNIFNGTSWDRMRNAIGAVLLNTGIGSTSVEEGGRLFNNIKLAAPTTTVVKSGPGHLHAIIVNTPLASGVITMYDNTAASGTEIGIITNPGTILSTGPNTVIYDIAFSTGLTVVTSGAAQNVTVSYR